MAWLRIIGGPQDGRTFQVGEAPVTIGRGASNNVELQDTKASRRHASLVWNGRCHEVVDHGSENGVYVDGERIFGKQALESGQRFQLGGTKIVYESGPGVHYAHDYTRHETEGGGEAVAETKGVSLAEVQRMMADFAADSPAPTPGHGRPSAGPAMPAGAAYAGDGGVIPLAVEPDEAQAPRRPAGPAQTPQTVGPAELRERIIATLKVKLAQGIDLMGMTDIVIAGLARGLTPDRAAILLKAGSPAALKPIKTWQRPDVPPGTPMPPLLRELVLQTVQSARPGGVATGGPLPAAGGAERRSDFGAICAPVIVRGVLRGVVYADCALRRGRDFTTDDLRFALHLASALAQVA